MPGKEDPWVDLEGEVEQLLESLAASFAEYVSAGSSNGAASGTPAKQVLPAGGASPAPKGNIHSIHADELVNLAEEVEEMLEDARIAVDLAINHPERFSIPTTEIQRRQDLLRQWERRSDAPRRDAKTISQHRAASEISAAGAAKGGALNTFSPRDGSTTDANGEFLRMQQEEQHRIVDDQDATLERLGEGVSRLKTKGQDIAQELSDQEKMLEEVERDMTVVQVKMETVAKKVGKLIDESSDRCKIITIIVLMVILVLLIVLLFSEDGSGSNN